MHWFLMSLIAPFLWSLLNHADKYLISKHSNEEENVGGLVVFSSLFAILIIPIAFFINSNVFSLTGTEKIFLSITGVFTSLAILFYLYALEKEDASAIVPFWLLTPVFAYIFGVLILGEHLSGIKTLGSLIVLLGALVLSLEFEENRKKINSFAIVLMIGSSFVLAITDTIFKKFAEHLEFWPSIFWNQIGMALFGIFGLIFITSYRKSFLTTLKKGSKDVVAINTVGELTQSVAMTVNNYALLIAPITLVLLVNYTFQPLFVFIEGILLTIFFPKISSENISKKHLIQKGVSILIMALGVYLVLM